MKKTFLLAYLIASIPLIISCSEDASPAKTSGDNSVMTTKEKVNIGTKSLETQNEETARQPDKFLAAVISANFNDIKDRYKARHPQETLQFFGIKPGMTVIEMLPGKGWYSKLLLPYLTGKGELIGADYAIDMYPKFGFFNEEQLEAKKSWVKEWTADAEKWRNKDSATINAFQLGAMPENIKGSADAVLFIRALHNLARFENDGKYLTTALDDAFQALKPGGIVGVVQHQARSTASDKWADGSNGYLKESYVSERMREAGFEKVASSEININIKDQPTEKDRVWRLPPTLATSKKDVEQQKRFKEVGESTRMTLLFRKPG